MMLRQRSKGNSEQVELVCHKRIADAEFLLIPVDPEGLRTVHELEQRVEIRFLSRIDTFCDLLSVIVLHQKSLLDDFIYIHVGQFEFDVESAHDLGDIVRDDV